MKQLSPPQATAEESRNYDQPAASDDELPPQIGRAETKAVMWSRLVVVTVLLVATICAAFWVLIFVRASENKAFTKQAEEDIEKIFDHVAVTLDQTLGGIDSLTVGLTAFAALSNATWPFVTIPNFGVRATKIRSLSKSFVVTLYPLVQDAATRTIWEAYTESHDHWVDESLEVQEFDDSFKGELIKDWSGNNHIHYHTIGDLPENETGPFLPTWETAPVVPKNHFSPYNWDVYKDNQAAMDEVVFNRRVVLALPYNLPPEGETFLTMEDNSAQWAAGLVGDSENPLEPFFPIYYPIVQNAHTRVNVADASNATNGDNAVVGVLALTMFWSKLFTGILPVGSDGIVVIVGNECSRPFSFELQGPNAKYLGVGDHHSQQFSDLGVNVTVGEFKKKLNDQYTGFPVSNELCSYWIAAYPTSVMEERFRNTDTRFMSRSVVCLFVFTAIVFGIYVYFNERRQKVIMNRAVQSSAIVSSLYPSVVRDRLFREEDGDGSSPTKKDTAPIAELFTATTVCKCYGLFVSCPLRHGLTSCCVHCSVC